MILLRRQLLRINHYKFGQLKIFPALNTDNYTSEEVGQFLKFMDEVSTKKQIEFQILEQGLIEVLNNQSLRDNNDVLMAINKTIYNYRMRYPSQNCQFLDEIAQMNQHRLLQPFQEFVYLIYSPNDHSSPQYLINDILLKQELNDEDINYLRQYKDKDLQVYIDFCLRQPIKGILDEQFLMIQISKIKNKQKLTYLLEKILAQINKFDSYQLKMIFKNIVDYLKRTELFSESENISLIKKIQFYCYTQIQAQPETIVIYGPAYLLSLHKLSTFTDVSYYKVLLEALLQFSDRLKQQFFYFQWITLEIIKLNNHNAIKQIQETLKIDKAYRDHLIEQDLIQALPILVLDNYQLELNQLNHILDFLNDNRHQTVVINLFVLLFRSTKLLKGLSTQVLDRLIEVYNRSNIKLLNIMTLSVKTIQVSKEISYIIERIKLQDKNVKLAEQCRFIYNNKQIFEQFPNLIKDLGLDRIYDQDLIDKVREEIIQFLLTESKPSILSLFLVSYSILSNVNELKIPIEIFLNKSKSVIYLKQILKSSIKYRQLLESSEVLSHFRGKDEYIDIFLKETTFDLIKQDHQLEKKTSNQDRIDLNDNIQNTYHQLMDFNIILGYTQIQLHQQIRKVILNWHHLGWIKIYNLILRLNQLNLDDFQLLYKLRQNIILMTKIDLEKVSNLHQILLVYEKVVTIQNHFQEEDLDEIQQQSIEGQFVIETMRRINGKKLIDIDLDHPKLQQFHSFFPYYFEGQKDFIKYFPSNVEKLHVAQFLYENNFRFQINLENMESYFKKLSFLSLDKLINLSYLVAQVDDQDTEFILKRIKQDLDRIQPQLNHLQSHRILPTIQILKELKIIPNKRLSNIINNSIWSTSSTQILRDILLSQILNIQTFEQIEDQLISLD